MSYRETIQRIGMRLTREQHSACAYLEAAGQRFCAEFGRDNAVAKAREHWRNRKTRTGKRVHQKSPW